MKDGMDNMNIELLTSGQAEAVSLSEQGMTITEYLYSLVSSENPPATMMINTANGELLRDSTPSANDEIRNIAIKDGDTPAMAGGQMRITINDMLTDNDVLLFRAKPKTQGVGIGEALQELIDSAVGKSNAVIDECAQDAIANGYSMMSVKVAKDGTPEVTKAINHPKDMYEVKS